jgi:hypothetical protein
MLRALTLFHRWLGVAFCLLFAMWFASGIVMHFVPFPALTEAERLAGLPPIDIARVEHGPAEAITASGLGDVRRVRLLQRSDGPVYVISGAAHVRALRAADLADAAIHSAQSALAIAVEHARQRRLNASRAAFAELAQYDQWTVANGFDAHRPLYRVALGDDAGTDLYVSSTTGEVVLDTTRRERWWNYVGSVAHWIYLPVLRHHDAAWSRAVWTLSLGALMAALAGALLGTIKFVQARLATPYDGWQAWHHVLGLISMTFVLTWIFSGWLSMDNGILFSTGEPTDADVTAVAGSAAWDALPHDDMQRISATAKEIEWFVFGGRTYRRERVAVDQQRLFVVPTSAGAEAPNRAFLERDEINAAASRLSPVCNAPVVLDANDDYPVVSTMPNAPVFRFVCGNDWFHIDGASGALLETLGPSRRSYRWLYRALHTLDFPALTRRPAMRTALILTLCGCGFAFCLTGMVIAWRRLLSSFRSS